LIAIGFDEPEFRGAIQRELSALRDLGLIRLIDALLVAKDDFGGVTRMEMSDLSEPEKMEFGALIGGMIGLGVFADMATYSGGYRERERVPYGEMIP
jgi:uncharacterized membrane protein